MSLSHEDIAKELEEYKNLVNSAREKVKKLQYPGEVQKIKAGFQATVTGADAALGGVGHLVQGGLEYAQGIGASNLASAEAAAKKTAARALEALSSWMPFRYGETARAKASDLNSGAVSAEQEALMQEINADHARMTAEEKANEEFKVAAEISSADFLDGPDLSFEAAERFFKNVEKNIDKIQKLLDRKDPKFCEKNPDKDLSKLTLLIKHAKEDVKNDSEQVVKSLSEDKRRGFWNNLGTSVSQAFESMGNAIKNTYKSKTTSGYIKHLKATAVKNAGFPTAALGVALNKAKKDAKDLENKLKEDPKIDFPRPKKRKEF
jgi:hypothetical protein